MSHFERSKSDQLTIASQQSPAIGHKLALIDFGITTELSKIKNKAGRVSDLRHLGDRTRYSIGKRNPVKQRSSRIFHPFFTAFWPEPASILDSREPRRG